MFRFVKIAFVAIGLFNCFRIRINFYVLQLRVKVRLTILKFILFYRINLIVHSLECNQNLRQVKTFTKINLKH